MSFSTFTSGNTRRARVGGGRSPLIPPLLLLSAFVGQAACAQEQSVESLRERSAIVIQGKVLKTHASDEPLLAASDQTVVVSVLRMDAGSEIAGDQTGRTATVILADSKRLKVGEVALFFGNPRFVGRTLTIADEGEVVSRAGAQALSSEMERGAQARRDRPVHDRLATAALVFRGHVEKIQPLDARATRRKGTSEPSSEHDPEWRVATVRIESALQDGKAGRTVNILFPSSRDIVWFNAPKLRAGQDAVFIAHAPDRENHEEYGDIARLIGRQRAYVVTAPSDVLPSQDEARVRNLLARAKENNP
ncbi:hypothetical protein [Lysobacter sp. CFH 32150]|uniref:hypothetical protein n=1 Tax=Lysobacter sp. CFH 32150 TaxID=2927128 RepID=UPI001FA7891F|nr:hypothetical protein [Lysobacter sp. CFH 32150]MCI4568960.1 hypothetical protein [Lysobacter sp. CFH 32150]